MMIVHAQLSLLGTTGHTLFNTRRPNCAQLIITANVCMHAVEEAAVTYLLQKYVCSSSEVEAVIITVFFFYYSLFRDPREKFLF